MESLKCYPFKVELQDTSPIQECQIKTEPFQDDLIEECPIKTETFQNISIEERRIKTEPFQDDPIEKCPLKIETFQDISIEEFPIETEKFQDKPIEECPIRTEIVDEDFVPETVQEEETSSEDPLEPTLRNKRLDSQAKLMILNVHRYFRKFRLIRAKETGEDMNVNHVVAQATGVSESAVKRLFSEYLNKGIERAIRPPAKTRTRKRKTDTIVDAGQDSATITVKSKRKK